MIKNRIKRKLYSQRSFAIQYKTGNYKQIKISRKKNIIPGCPDPQIALDHPYPIVLYKFHSNNIWVSKHKLVKY